MPGARADARTLPQNYTDLFSALGCALAGLRLRDAPPSLLLLLLLEGELQHNSPASPSLAGAKLYPFAPWPPWHVLAQSKSRALKSLDESLDREHTCCAR